ncbi:MFS transporter [Bacillus paralicheniformis]|uniref:MFS transporter n=1 Tax=Bacillus paralicheniformis TaxID=1648923 RepID=UPI00232DD18D|nr:MFS transporter [Bacillus paralicheniformis]
MKKMARLYILMLNVFIVMLGIGLIIPLMPTFIEEFGASGSTLGLLIAASGITQLLFSPVAGEMTDKYGRRKMIILGIGAFAVSQLLFALASQMWLLFVSRLLGGAGAAFLVPAMFAYIADITSEKDRSKGMGLISAAMSLGFVIGPGAGGYLAAYGLTFPFYVSAGLAGLATVLSLFVLPETLSQEKMLEKRRSAQKREPLPKQMARALRSPYAFLFVLVFILNFGIMNFEAVFSLYVDHKHGFTPGDIAFVITAASLIGVFVQAVALGMLTNRFGEKKLMNMTLIGSAAALAVCSLAGSYWLVFGATIVFFMLTSILRPAINTLISKMAGDEQGFAAGMNNAFMSLANIVGPTVAGLLFDVNVEIPYIFGAIVLVLSFLAAVSWGRKQQTRAIPEKV